jgi:Mce-associated membrane protein
MSSSQPPRRRRIAGERRRTQVSPPESEPASETGSEPRSVTSAASPTTPARQKASARQKAPRAPRAEKPKEKRREKGKERPGRRPAAPAWWGTTQSLVALAVALVVLLTLVGLGALGMLNNTGVQDVREAEEAQVAAETAPSVAERAAEAILAYDHRKLDADQAAAEKFMTSSFAEEYSATFERTVKEAARTYKATVTAEVKGSSVVRASSEEVRVLLFVDQTTRSTAHQRPQVALNRVEFQMVQRDGDWLVDGISSY